MSVVSFLDPSVLELDYIDRMVDDVEGVINTKEAELSKNFDLWEQENKPKRQKNEDYYDAMEDNFVNEQYFISELSANLFNGLAITINTLFEIHIKTFVREMCKQESSIKYDKGHTYKMSELLKIMKVAHHPNVDKINQDILDRLRSYTNIRNAIVHHEGIITEGDFSRDFILDNKTFFKFNKYVWKISVKAEYIRTVIRDLETFFKLLAYKSNGDVIFY